jgi:hypothetical protein
VGDKPDHATLSSARARRGASPGSADGPLEGDADPAGDGDSDGNSDGTADGDGAAHCGSGGVIHFPSSETRSPYRV